MKNHFLLPGQWWLGQSGYLVSTILGSCVSIVLYDPTTKWVAINHYLLPERLDPNIPKSTRYGDIATSVIIDEISKKGVLKKNVEAKIYGGANVNEGNTLGVAIGASNIIVAVQSLAILQIPIIEQNVGGFRGRKITFNTSTYQTQVQFNS